MTAMDVVTNGWFQTVVLGGVVLLGLKKYLFRAKPTVFKKDWVKDKVYLYQFKRLNFIPSISPFALKLETWLRLKKIPFESSEENKFSRGGRQVPFIELNGEEIFDSNVIIPFLDEKFQPEKDALDDQNRGASLALVRMMDEHMVHSYFWYRYVDHWNDEFYPLWTFPIPTIGRFFLSNFQAGMIKKKGWWIGHGRLSYEQIYKLGMDDIKALSLFLGDKKFLHGDEITTTDCCAFGHLCQILFIPINHPHKKFMDEECPNLAPYVERIKAELWPDWDEMLSKVPW